MDFCFQVPLMCDLPHCVVLTHKSVFTLSSRYCSSNAVFHGTLICDIDESRMGEGCAIPVPCPLSFTPRGSWDGFAVWDQFANQSFRWRFYADWKNSLACHQWQLIKSRFSHNFAISSKVLHFVMMNTWQLIWGTERRETHLAAVMLCFLA